MATTINEMFDIVTKVIDNQNKWLECSLEKDQKLNIIQKQQQNLQKQMMSMRKQCKNKSKQAELFRNSHTSVSDELKQLKRLYALNLLALKDKCSVLKRKQDTINFLQNWLMDKHVRVRAAPGTVLERLKNEVDIKQTSTEQ